MTTEKKKILKEKRRADRARAIAHARWVQAQVTAAKKKQQQEEGK